MKKILLLVLVGICIVIQLSAQTEKQINFGVKVGSNHTVINGYETNGDKIAFIGSSVYSAIYAEMLIGTTTYLNSELVFSFTNINDWSCLEIPFHIRQLLNSKASLFMGPKLDLVAGKLNQSANYKSIFCGLSFESGAQYNFVNHIFIEGRYSIGISKQFANESFDINDGKRNTLRFGLGYRF